MVGARHHVEVVLDHEHGVPGFDEPLQDLDQLRDVGHVKPHGGLVQHVERVGARRPADLRELIDQLDALRFAARERGRRLTQGWYPSPTS